MEHRMFTGPLFVVGAPRSGTKLFRDLLRQHSRVGIPTYETEFLPRLMLIADSFGDLSQESNFARFYAWATRYMYFKYLRDDGACITMQQWYSGCRTYTVAGVFEALIRHDAAVAEDGIWGDKSPNYRNHLPEIAALWPEARFIHIVRDVRDVCLSSRQAWGKHMLRNAQRWMDEVGACRRAGQRLGGRYFELRYEDLLARPEPTLRAVAAFLGLDFEPAMLKPGRVSENLGDTRGADKIVAGNQEKWRDRMSPSTLARVEAVCGPLLGELGYPLALGPQPPARLSEAEMLLYKAMDGANLLRFRVKEWGLADAVRYSVSAWESTRA